VRSCRFFLMAVVLLASLGPATAHDQESTASANYEPQKDLMLPRYFEETGFWIQGHFREYWETRGGLFVFGYPITSVFWHEEDGLYKQFLQRAILVYHPGHAGTEYEVLLKLLGNELAEDRRHEPEFQPVEPFEDSESHRFFPATGHAIGHGFKSFWEANDGQRNFGYPISIEFDERNEPPPAGDGEIHTVQYFERNRFEWHPEHRGTTRTTSLS
jgi:polysaccharide biosynthesis protein PslG